jgi:predicted esterase
MPGIIFIHGLESSGTGFKGQFFKRLFPECLTPDFHFFDASKSIKQLLEIRMNQLNSILINKNDWIIIGSSFGGLMSALYTCENPEKVLKLILLAPYLSNPYLDPKMYNQVMVPVILFHGRNDKVIPLTPTKTCAEKLFKNLTYIIVDDDHRLIKTVKCLDWKKLISNK